MGDLDEISKKERNQETQSTAFRPKKSGTCEGRRAKKSGEKIERERGRTERVRVSKLQILRKSQARDTQRHLAPGRMHLTAQTMHHRDAARRWVTQAWVYITIKSRKRGKRIKKAICREIIKTKTRAARGRKETRQSESNRERKREEGEGGRESKIAFDRTRERRERERGEQVFR